MSDVELILSRLENIENLLSEQTLLRKDVLNLKEAAAYLQLSESHLYKLTSSKLIPHTCPSGKKLYFNREKLDQWLQRNPIITNEDIQQQAEDYLIKNKFK